MQERKNQINLDFKNHTPRYYVLLKTKKFVRGIEVNIGPTALSDLYRADRAALESVCSEFTMSPLCPTHSSRASSSVKKKMIYVHYIIVECTIFTRTEEVYHMHV